ncbi:glycosyltransferase family 4 protein [Yersinia pseudotuberculosis]|nr:glycosyltransferase family 4 protein [Yersinia pseudotuberculosis]CFV22441.1 putative glycosyl transferase [Yersinia pseudotuberculosis]
MKILYIITKANEIGGAQIHIKDLCIRLLNDGNEPEVIVGENGALVDFLINENIKVHILPSLVRDISPIKDMKCILQMRKLVKEINPDVVTIHSSKAGIIGRLSLICSGLPVIFTAHGWSFANGINDKRKFIYIWIEKFCAIFSDKIITVSKQDKDLAIKYKVATDEQQIIIHNGILGKSVENKKNDNETCIRLISIARFCEQKDHETLLKALALINNNNWNLSLIGKGPCLEKTKLLTKELGLNDKVIFLGERLDVEVLLASSDVFLLISNWEGFPISILEAMRASLPVIASDVGGVCEAVNHGDNGFLVNRKDIYGLSKVIETLIENKELRLKMGKCGESLFKNDFDFESMYQKTLSVYSDVFNKRKLKG